MTPEIVLHIGCDKTGTTWIQQLFRQNRAALLRRGCLYPRSPGRVKHWDLNLYALPDRAMTQSRIWKREGYSSPERFRRRVRRRLLREVAESGASKVVLSDEALCRADEDSIRRLHELVAQLGRPARVVVYLRRQDDRLVSSYQQAVKIGAVHDFATWSRRDFSGSYDYAELLARWQRTYRPTELVVRPFERPRLTHGSLEQDFLEAAGLEVQAAELRPVQVRNESLGMEAVELLRILNLHRIENGTAADLPDTNRPFVGRLRDFDTGPRLTLPDAELDRFMDRWAASNRRVAADHLGDPTGQLFREARKAKGTTVQLLDPARLGLYLELLEIPPCEHAAIRAIAEREAVRDQRGGRP